MIIDSHPHLLSDEPDRYPVAPYGGIQGEWSKGIHVTAEEFLDLMDKAGIDKAVVVQPSGVYGVDNRYCVDSAERYPERFVSVVTIDMLAADAPDTLSHWVEQRGARGLRLFTTGSGYEETTWLDDPSTFGVWRRARDLGIPVCVMIRPSGISRLRRVLDAFPDVPVILDHLGGPDLSDGPPYSNAQPLFDLAEYPNLHLKLTTLTLQRAGEGQSTPDVFLRRLIARFGAPRIMWGSNYPNSRSDAASGAFQGLVELARAELGGLPESERDWLWGGTALRLYPDLA